MRKIFAVVIAIAFSFSYSLSISQTTPVKQWDARFGGNSWDNLYSLQQTSDGGYILGGTSSSGISGDKTQARQGGYDYWIVKTDSNGVKQWDARFGGNRYEYLYCLQQTSDGGYILGGSSFSGISGDKTQASQGGPDYWIVKTDSNGVKQWDARFGGSSYDYLYSLQQTSDGGYILGGESASGVGGDRTKPSRGGYDYWIVKTDSNGVKQWDARFGGIGYDALYSLQQTTDGGYILGGESLSSIGGDKSQESQGFADYWIVKTNANGVKQWDARFGGSKYEEFRSLRQTSDGGYILGGRSPSGISGDKTQANWDATLSTTDYWIVKADSSGAKQWDARLGGSDYDNLNSLQQTTDGGYILGGSSYSDISGDKSQESQGWADYWIVKTDASGLKEWDTRFGGSSDDVLYSLQQTSDDGYTLGGYSQSGISGDKTQTSQGLGDYWIVKLSSETSSCTTPTATITPLGNPDICETGFVKLQASSGIGYTYQWNRNNVDLPGQVYQTLKAKKPGNYRVRISTGPGCSATSKKIIVYSSCKLGEETELASSLNIYPNPTSGTFTLDLQLDDEETSQAQLQLVNMLGQSIPIESGELKIENGRLVEEIQLRDDVAEGMYLAKVIVNDKIFTTQIDLQK